MGYLSWSGGMPSYMTSTIARNTENYSFMAQLQVKRLLQLSLIFYCVFLFVKIFTEAKFHDNSYHIPIRQRKFITTKNISFEQIFFFF